MTHFGENTEFINDDPVNLMLPSDLTKNVSILNYRAQKFQYYEVFTSQTQGKTLVCYSTMINTLDSIPINIIYKRVQGSLDLASPRSFHYQVRILLNKLSVGQC